MNSFSYATQRFRNRMEELQERLDHEEHERHEQENGSETAFSASQSAKAAQASSSSSQQDSPLKVVRNRQESSSSRSADPAAELSPAATRSAKVSTTNFRATIELSSNQAPVVTTTVHQSEIVKAVQNTPARTAAPTNATSNSAPIKAVNAPANNKVLSSVVTNTKGTESKSPTTLGQAASKKEKSDELQPGEVELAFGLSSYKFGLD
jgi:hypothetical protein